MNVEGDRDAQQDVVRLGIPRVPAVVVGDRVVHGWNPAGYAKLLGVDYRPAVQLAPAELAARLDRVLGATGRLVATFPDAVLDSTPPERNRTVRHLAYHVFRVALSFIDAMDQGALPERWFDEGPPPDVRDGARLAAEGERAREQLRRWFEAATPDVYARVVEVYYGPQSAHDLLERTAWHAAQHLRQLHVLAGRHGITPPEPPPADAFADLPMPESIW